MENHSVILIGSNNKNTLGKARSFGEAGFIPIVIWVGPRANLVKYCRYVKEFYDVESAEMAVALLEEKFKKPGGKILVSIEGDGLVAELDKNYDRLKDYFIFYNAGEQGRLSFYLEKYNLTEAAREVGFHVPLTEELEVGALPTKVSYPVITKAADSFDIGWKSSTHICKSEQELKDAYKELKCKRIIVQEYVSKKNELMLEGVSINGGDEVFLPIQGSFYRLPSDAYGSYGFFEQYHLGDELLNRLKKLLKIVGFSGVFEVEFIIAENQDLYFLEINFRDTMWNHVFTQMGVNLNRIWADSVMLGNLVIGDARVISSPHSFMNEITDYNRYVKTKKIRIRNWLIDFFRCKSYMVYDRSDNKPFNMYLISVIARRLQRLGLFKNSNFHYW